MQHLLDIFLHLDQHLLDFVRDYGSLTYALLAFIIFAETGLVVTPFLPGDALLLGAGIVWAQTDHNPYLLFVLLAIAAILGNIVNYYIGRTFGDVILKRNIIKEKYLQQTHDYFEKYGAFTIVVARFAPFVRTFAPFIAGMSKMSYSKFLGYNAIGAIAWTATFIFAGYLFGETEFVKNNFKEIELAVIAFTTLPVLFTVAKQFFAKDKTADEEVKL